MLAKDLSGFDPVVDLFRSELFLTARAQLLNFSRLWVASRAEVIEEESEVGRDDAAVVFADVLWAELKLAGLDVALSLLDESSIKHDAEERCVAEAAMLKYNLDVTMERANFSLVCVQLEARAALFAEVPPLGLVGEEELGLKPYAMVYFEEWEDAAARHRRDFEKLDSS
jgi:hypothetical protein